MFSIQGHIFLKKFPADWVSFFEDSKTFKEDGGTVAVIERKKKRSDEQYSVVCSREQTFHQRGRGRMKERMPISQESHCLILLIALSTALFFETRETIQESSHPLFFVSKILEKREDIFTEKDS